MRSRPPRRLPGIILDNYRIIYNIPFKFVGFICFYEESRLNPLEIMLKAEANAAIEAHEFARDELWRIQSNQNVGWSKEVQEARDRQDVSRQAVVEAIIRLTDFMRRGTVPGNLTNLNVLQEGAEDAF
jgi:hypothetical protein